MRIHWIYSEHMANSQNLKPWQPGQSGNPAGKPKGAKHLSTWIRELLDDEKFEYKLKGRKRGAGAPIEAIIRVLIIKALNGDLRAFELLATGVMKLNLGPRIIARRNGLIHPVHQQVIVVGWQLS